MFKINNPLKVALVYAIIGTLWIIFSDLVAEWLFSNKADLAIAQTIKGIVKHQPPRRPDMTRVSR